MSAEVNYQSEYYAADYPNKHPYFRYIADRILLTACKEFAQWVNENIINDQSKK